MNSYFLRRPAVSTALLSVALSAATGARSSGNQSTTKIDVQVYGYSQLSVAVLGGAEKEATRIFKRANIELLWTHCLTLPKPGMCSPSPAPDSVAVRFVPFAYTTVGDSTLATADGETRTAFIFCDRIVQLRTNARPLETIFGRVLAHEIVHMLTRERSHTLVGLMRAIWSEDDFRFDKQGGLDLSPHLVETIRLELDRRRLLAASRQGR